MCPDKTLPGYLRQNIITEIMATFAQYLTFTEKFCIKDVYPHAGETAIRVTRYRRWIIWLLPECVHLQVSATGITPYGNGIHHINSIMQPSTATIVPVVGVAICTESVVPGCATGASHETDIALVVKFVIEVAKEFGRGICNFYDAEEYDRLVVFYGSMSHLQLLK
ncbi:DUF1177 family protein [Yersinia rochesterensis]|uniref:DUF1177 family protein n=1 Tax=Yersinia rochesterensis TaxID=1604335 RepID=A0A8D4N2T0_9GAMM|nr:DUF1177 family protein [Yersinia rochesterensis]